MPTRPPLRVALLTSRCLPGLAQLLAAEAGHGSLFQVVGCVASGPLRADDADRLQEAGIAVVAHDVRDFCHAGGARWTDLHARAHYDRATAALVRDMGADVVVLCGYLLILTAPMLEAFPERILNIHDADLQPGPGRPRYTGLHATYDAIAAGARETRSTVHMVTARVDAGPALVRSWAFPVHALAADARAWGAHDVLRAYAYAQREWMMRAAWGPALALALRRLARGQVRLVAGRAIVAGSLGPESLEPPEGLEALESLEPPGGIEASGAGAPPGTPEPPEITEARRAPASGDVALTGGRG